MNKQKDRKLCLWKTILASIWSYLVLFMFFIGSLLHSRDMIIASSDWKEISFWGTIMFLLVLALSYLLPMATFYFYKKQKTQKGEKKND
jgi:hypothetical protein